MKKLVLQVIDAIRKRLAESPPPPDGAGRVAHLQHADHPNRTTWPHAEIQA